MDTKEESYSNGVHNSPVSFFKNISTRFNIHLYYFLAIVCLLLIIKYRKSIKSSIKNIKNSLKN